ncbi:MAG: hypothetical protein LN561_02915 [Rickettsia endosymbiont of Labidopullus appendiculatus]|nr:hypothetical protein [Rickettsia endosymbiont of Labidopullus appendiculatus]
MPFQEDFSEFLDTEQGFAIEVLMTPENENHIKPAVGKIDFCLGCFFEGIF